MNLSAVAQYPFGNYHVDAWPSQTGLVALKRTVWHDAFTFFDSRVSTDAAIAEANEYENRIRLHWLQWNE